MMSAEGTFYISLLVHEKAEVILDQLKNFRRFAPSTIIVVHISPSFSLDTEFVNAVLALGNVHINPVRVPTNKVNLLYPHLVNLRHILKLSTGEGDKVGFHASNDMLVKHGLEQHVQKYQAGYFFDGVLDRERQPESAALIDADASFLQLMSLASARTVIWSQIEGIFFPAKHLRTVIELIDQSGADMGIKRLYYAEEVILPSLVHALLDPNDGEVTYPYIFSEISFWAKYWEISQTLFKRSFLARCFRVLLRIIGPIRITPRVVDGIRKGDLGFYDFFKKVNGKIRYRNDQLFGVKRVEREINDPLRVYISKLS